MTVIGPVQPAPVRRGGLPRQEVPVMCNKTTWAPTEGQRAWYGDRNCDVVRIHPKAQTATVQFWGRGLLDGKLVTMRGVRLSNLSAPRKLIGSDDSGNGVYVDCCGSGQRK